MKEEKRGKYANSDMTRLSISVAGDVVVTLDWKIVDEWRRAA